MKPKLIYLEKKQDERGILAEVTSVIPGKFKHEFVATLNPGATRGNHYHKRKTEWVLVLEGSIQANLTSLDKSQVASVALKSEDFILLEIEPSIIVSLVNNTDHRAIFLAIFDETFDPDDPDVWIS